MITLDAQPTQRESHVLTPTMSALIKNIDALRKRKGKRPLTKRQVAMIHEQDEMRRTIGRVTCNPNWREEVSA